MNLGGTSPCFPAMFLVSCSDDLDKVDDNEIIPTVLENSDPPQLAQRLMRKTRLCPSSG